MTQQEQEQMVNLFVQGKSMAEVALLFPTWSHGTIANFKSRKKVLIWLPESLAHT
jgi:hypothetical protein